MEIERLSYIFGSFARRRQSREIAASGNKRSSVGGSTKISHDRSKSAPHQQTTKTNQPKPHQRTKSVVCKTTEANRQNKYECRICGGMLVEPRVLPCLHTFCCRCLEGSVVGDAGEEELGSTADLHQSQVTTEGRKGSLKFTQRKHLTCPICGTRFQLSPQGISVFPINYLLQHRLVLATLNANVSRLLCDICTPDVKASTRCNDCAISLCDLCTDIHRKQKDSTYHEVLPIKEAIGEGKARVRRQIMCTIHPENEITIYCSACYRVICHVCSTTLHRSHECESIPRAARKMAETLKTTITTARTTAEQSSSSIVRLQAASAQFERQCNQVQNEVEEFIGSYISAVKKHRDELLRQIEEVKSENTIAIEEQRRELERQVEDARSVATFAEDLLTEADGVEVLSLAGVVLQKMKTCGRVKEEELKVSTSLQFLPREVADNSASSCPLYGVISKQTVSVKNCVLNVESLQNLRVGKKAEVILETKDKNDVNLERGGEHVVADLTHKNSGVTKITPVNVKDLRNGKYLLTFTTEIAGKTLLSVNIKGVPIKNSPFHLLVRTIKPHQGTFHCCSFCSSGGSKEATCGCGGKMPGGYKGCGHGHEGHPGRRHWSCCGNVVEHSECGRTNSTHYHITI